MLLINLHIFYFKTQMKEFSAKMRNNLPQKDGDFVQKFDSWKLPRSSTENDEKEWEEALSK